jgi:uncharacterized protein (TIGR02246 family)
MASHPIEKELIELEKQYWQALKDKDVEAMLRLTDDRCIVTGSQGVGRFDRETLASMVKEAPWSMRDFQVKDGAEVQMLREDLAVVAYRVREELDVAGEPVTLEAADTSSWVRRDGRWVCAVHTEALLGDPFGRDRHPAGAAAAPEPELSDEAAVSRLYSKLMEAWRAGDAEAFASVFAEDGQLVAFDGTRIDGRAAIAAFHEPLFRKYLKGSRLVGKVVRVRFPSPEVAVMHATGSTVMRGRQAPSPERDSIQTLVAARRDGDWQIVAFQNTRIRPIGRSPVGTLLWLFTDLLWRLLRPRR